MLAGDDWLPYVDKNAEDYGFACKIITSAFAKVGINVDYHFVDWARALEMVKNGTVDGSFLWYKTAERAPLFFFSEQPLLKISVVFFHRSDFEFKWNTLDDLSGYKIGAPIGALISPEFSALEAQGKLNVIRIKSDINLFKMLYKERIDLFPHDFFVGYAELNTHFSPKYVGIIKNDPKPILEMPAYLLLSMKKPKNKALITLFDKGLSMLKRSGEYDKLFDEFILKSH
ncbi:substrate-binding periplasmic protein [Zooshikella sp. RANM57]|uniref:substrate-binding periplasmic protein n=1 Tax=Zooshikella sp. RANM57 TaxID=3425863 RepID=UPI003D6E1291